jgi:hypothetical protein
LRPETKLFLHTDGTKFEVWMGTAEVPGNNLWNFLEDLADSCRLPPDPASSVKLLNIRWKTNELQRTQFEQLHRDFATALSQYVTLVAERSSYFMKTQGHGGGVDASSYPIVYDNSWEHFTIQEWDLPVGGQTTPMIKWVHELQKFAEGQFHISLGRER